MKATLFYEEKSTQNYTGTLIVLNVYTYYLGLMNWFNSCYVDTLKFMNAGKIM